MKQHDEQIFKYGHYDTFENVWGVNKRETELPVYDKPSKWKCKYANGIHKRKS